MQAFNEPLPNPLRNVSNLLRHRQRRRAVVEPLTSRSPSRPPSTAEGLDQSEGQGTAAAGENIERKSFALASASGLRVDLVGRAA